MRLGCTNDVDNVTRACLAHFFFSEAAADEELIDLGIGSRTICLDKSQRLATLSYPAMDSANRIFAKEGIVLESRHEHLERSICHLRRWDVRDNRLEDRCQAG